MFSLFRRKPHVHKFEEEPLSAEITLYETIRFQSCRCGKQRIIRIRMLDGRVVIHYPKGDE